MAHILDKSVANGFPSFFPPSRHNPCSQCVAAVTVELFISSSLQFIYTIRHINDISRAAFGCNLHRHTQLSTDSRLEHFFKL